MKNTGKVYEHLVQDIYREILRSEGVNNIKVEHDVTLKGKTTDHQIDVYWEHEIGNSKFRMIIQAKDWKSAVPQKEMLAFAEIIKDLPTGTKGVFVSKSGYQKGAVDVAKANGIDIYELREPNMNDFKNKMTKIKIDINIEMPYYKDISIVVDKNRCPNINEKRVPISGNLLVYEKNRKITIRDLVLELCEQNGKNIRKCEYKFNEGYIFFREQKIFIHKLIGIFGLSQANEQMNVNVFEKIGLILKDIINKEAKIFDKQNKFMKNVQE